MISISTIEELQLIGNDPGYLLSDDYELTRDIDASVTSGWGGGIGFVPIGDTVTPFTGTFDGKGYYITDLFIDTPINDAGMFGQLSGATVKNLNIRNCDITCSAHAKDAGILAVSIINNSTVTNCTFHGDVTSDGYTCGVAYEILASTVSHCDVNWVGKTFTADYSACGICGMNTGAVSDCTVVLGTIVGNYGSDHAGCCYFNNTGTISNCSVAGGIPDDGGDSAGFCYVNSGTISDSSYSGAFESGSFGGMFIFVNELTGLVSGCSAEGTFSSLEGGGAFCFQSEDDSIIENSFVDCIATSGDGASGFGLMCYSLVDNAIIRNCYAIGEIHQSGGTDWGWMTSFVPFTDYNTVIENCYSVVTAFSGTTVIDFALDVGGWHGTFTNNYFDDDIVTLTAGYGATAKTTTQMKQEATFSGWNFSTIWEMVETMTYPLFSASYSLEIEVRNLGIYCKSADIDISLDGNGFSLAVYALTAKTPGEFRSYSFSEPLLLSNSVISAATLSDT